MEIILAAETPSAYNGLPMLSSCMAMFLTVESAASRCDHRPKLLFELAVINNSISVSLISALLFLSLLSCGPHTAAQLPANSSLVELIPIELDSRNPDKKEFDHLTFLKGFQLRSRDPRFGGLSGLTIGADGKLYSVSDRGYWVSARMNLDADGRLIDLTDWNI